MDSSPVTLDSIIITIIYTILLFWGVWIGVRQVYQGFRRPQKLLNPLFGNKTAISIFTVHLIIVSLDLFVCGPLALHYKSKLWYWGGRIALLTASLPLAFYFNRNPQSFGKLIGIWVRIRNYFEISLHVLVAAIALNWFYYYGLLYWLVAYRYLDVGPRRLFQTFYNTPEKLSKRPWAPTLNWVVIVSIYILTAVAIYYRKVIYLAPPAAAMPEHTGQSFEWAIVVALNVAIAMLFLSLMRRYTGPGPAAALLPVAETKAAQTSASGYLK
ncbi:MAG: hypothetical protein M3040_17330 [Bacteroidota bacterium]|nr:hypothetical protein [Bacteroidota bacterium]